MKELEYPLDSLYLLKKRRSLKKTLLAQETPHQEIKIAILGGSTTNEIANILELFLLNIGFSPTFYQSEYNQYRNDVMFSNSTLVDFAPDLIYVHTCHRNIITYPSPTESFQAFQHILKETEAYFTSFWDKIGETFSCPVIQNNFEHPPYRLLGNQDIVQGQSAFLQELNVCLSNYARMHPQFYVHDLQYLSAQLGLSQWHDTKAWNLYKYALSMEAIPHLAFSLSHIIGSLFGKQKKALVLDLDNTLWGGVVGDDGVENLKLGQGTGEGESFLAFQGYVKSLQDLGVLLTVASKNDLKNALEGLAHPDSLLKPEDFLSIQANWNSKDKSISTIASDLNIGLDSLVFVDDNQAEQTLVSQNLPSVSVIPLEQNSDFIEALDRSGYFELTSHTEEDKNRQKMYQENKQRKSLEQTTENYEDYLKSLEMVAEITGFTPFYIDRIGQLTNKTNQFNLTTKRYSKEALDEIAQDDRYLCLSGSLKDKFGDNGLVSVVVGKEENQSLSIDLWLMSCRVLQRNLEYAMMDMLVKKSKERGIKTIKGTYLPTAKNAMVKDFYANMGFSFSESLPDGSSVWVLSLEAYHAQNRVMTIIQE